MVTVTSFFASSLRSKCRGCSRRFVDASGLTALIETRALVDGRGGQLSLQDPRPTMVRLLEIADLAATFGVRTAMSVEDR